MIATDLSPDVRLLADRLAAVPKGETITLADLSQTIGRDIARCRHIFYAAARVAEREAGAVFAGERGVGYRRLTATEAPTAVGATARARIRGQARRGGRAIKAAVAHANDLSPEAGRRANAEIAALGLLEHIARDRTITNMDKSAERPMPVAEAARMFLTNIGALRTPASEDHAKD